MITTDSAQLSICKSPPEDNVVNTSDRPSQFITTAQARNLFEAKDFAYVCLRTPLNRLNTINWSLAGFDGRIQSANSVFLKHAGDWLRLRGVTIAYLYVHEFKSGCLHTHLMIFVPQEYQQEFGYRQRPWLKAAGAPWPNRKGVINTKPVGNPDRYDEAGHLLIHGIRLVEYLCKGADESTHKLFEFRRREFQGEIQGKRSGTSQSIGPQARRIASQAKRWNASRVIYPADLPSWQGPARFPLLNPR